MITRLGLWGGPRPLYGSFAGKIEAPNVTANWSSDYNLHLDIIR